ncbi:MAG: AAA family ATPase [Fibrobacter sp.]|nr:AAA family ATPase [Fibrobacter sp.]
MFVGRTAELERLQTLWNKSVASLVTIRGRRRIGKSTLVLEFAKRSKAKFIKLEGLQPVDGVNNGTQLAAFDKQLSKQTKKKRPPSTSWFDAFSALEESLPKKGRVVVLLDEISWMGKFDPGFAGELKQAWDNWFSKRENLIIFLCGSVSSWIDKKIVKSKAFLGRPSMNLVLQELPLNECVEFWGKAAKRTSTREIIDVLSVTGGVPEYLENINPALSADENIKSLCFRPGALLVSEFEEIFNDTLDANLGTKRKMLYTLSERKLTATEIADELHLENNGHVSDNLNELELAGFIMRDDGINPASGKKSNLGKYRIKDNYTRFYLKYIEPKRNLIEKDAFRFLSLEQLPAWNSILGLQFENLVMSNLHLLLQKIGLDNALITSAAPYVQNKTNRQQGCQIDLLIQTAKCAYLVEMKRRNIIDESVVCEVEEKMNRLKLKKGMSLRPVLVYEGNLSKRVPADAFFSHIISVDELLGRSLS